MDPSNALLPGATIRAKSLDTGVITTTVSNESGAFKFPILPPGKYTLSASLSGYQTKNIIDIPLTGNMNFSFNLALASAAVPSVVDIPYSSLLTKPSGIGPVLREDGSRIP